MLTTNPKGDTHWYGDDDNLETCPNLLSFHLKSNFELDNQCKNFQNNPSSCNSDRNKKFVLSSEKHDKNRKHLQYCGVENEYIWFSADNYVCNNLDRECVMPEGSGGSDYYAKPHSQGTSLDIAPCYSNEHTKLYYRIKNPDILDEGKNAWSDVTKVCNTENLKFDGMCKRWDQLISCEQRTSETCENVEPGCNFFSGSHCCSWNTEQNICEKNTEDCSRHKSFTDCNSDPTKVCRWGPTYSFSHKDNRPIGCYNNKDYEDAYLNTSDNTCRSPYYYPKNYVWYPPKTEGLSCVLENNRGNSDTYFSTKEECENSLLEPVWGCEYTARGTDIRYCQNLGREKGTYKTEQECLDKTGCQKIPPNSKSWNCIAGGDGTTNFCQEVPFVEGPYDNEQQCLYESSCKKWECFNNEQGNLACQQVVFGDARYKTEQECLEHSSCLKWDCEDNGSGNLICSGTTNPQSKYSTEQECITQTNNCGNPPTPHNPPTPRFGCLNQGKGTVCTQFPSDLKLDPSYISLEDCETQTNYCGKGSPSK